MTDFYTLPGLPSDILDSDRAGVRRLKASIDPDLSRKLESSIDIFGQLGTTEYTPIVGQKPLPGLSLLRDKKVGGDADFSVVGGEIKIDGSLGLRSLYTKDYGLYIPGLLGLAGLRVRSETPQIGTVRKGYGNAQGERVGMESIDGAWKTFIESEGVRWYEKPRSEWLDPLDGTGPSGLDAGNLNGATFRIVLGWYGDLSILFTTILPDREKGDRLVVFDSSGTRDDGVTLAQPDLPIFAEAEGCTIYVGGRQYGVLGRFRPQFRIASSRAITKSIGTTLTPIVSMRVKDEQRWQSVPVSLAGETVLSQVNAEYVLIVGGTLTGAQFASIDGISPDETALEVDSSATAVTGGYRAPGGVVAGGTGNNFGETETALPNINIPSGEVVTLAAVSLGGTGDITGVLRMRELW